MMHPVVPSFFRRLTAAVLLFTAMQISHAADLFWTNTAGGLWTTTTNWSPNQVPTNSDAAWLTNAGTYTVTNTATISVSNVFLGLTSTNNLGIPTLALNAGAFNCTNFTSASNGVIALAGGTFKVTGAFDSAGKLNQSVGTTWQLQGYAQLGNYNLTNGDQRGGTLWVTNLNWQSGNFYADANGDRIIIPTNGVLNFGTAAARYLTYNAPATSGRGLDNLGIWNWSGDAILYGLQTGCRVNNYGTLNMTNGGVAQFAYLNGYSAPTFNNYGSFIKATGTNLFYFNGVYVNNANLMEIQTGILSMYASTFTNSLSLVIQAAAYFQNDNASSSVFAPGSGLYNYGADHFSIPTGNVYLQNTIVASPTLLLNGGTLWQQAANAVPTINQTAGSWRLTVTTAVNTYNLNGGELRGGTLTVTNLNWLNGQMNLDVAGDKTIIPVGGILNMPNATTRYLSYYVGPAGRGLDNYGTWNWSGDSVLAAYGSGVVNNYGAVNVTSAGDAQFSYVNNYPSPTWNNYGTFTKSGGANNFYFQGVYLNNYNLLNFQSGLFVPYASTFSNFATVNISASASFYNQNGSVTVLATNSTLTSPATDHLQVQSGNVYLLTTNLASPTWLINGGTLWQQAPNVVTTINHTSGTWRHTVNTAVNTYNFSNGDLRGGVLTVTNLNWINGNMNADVNGDKTIIPVGGVVNFTTANSRYLSYNSGPTYGRSFDNYGTFNWTGDSVFVGVGAATVNNYGTVSVTGAGNAQFSYNSGYPAPTWNNYGTFTKSSGTNIFYFQGCYLNNYQLLNFQSGYFIPYGSTFSNFATVTLSASANFWNQNGSASTFVSNSVVTSPGVDHLQVQSGNIYLQTTNLTSPTWLINGGVLWQQTNNVVAIVNHTSGTWRHTVNTAVDTYNFSGGDLRGGILTITNCNWTNGNMNADANGDKTIIPIGGVLNFPTATARYLSYNTAAYGRGLDIFGTMNWSGDSQLVGVGAQTVNNYGAVNVTGTGIAQFTYASGYPAPTWNNFGTFTKSGGTNIFYFQGCYLNNTNVINFLSGSLNPYATTFTNLGSVSLAANALFQNDNGSVTYLQPGSSFAAASANALRIPSGTVYLRTPDVTTPAILISGGTLQQETNCAVTTINENTGTWLPTVPVNFNTYNLTNGDLRGADVTLANFNWLGGNLYSSTGGGTNVTVNTSLNISGGTTKNISYLVAQPSRTLINNGVGNWSGASISGSGSATIRNNNSLTLSNDVALAWSGSGVTPFLINNGSLTKISGNGSSAFGSCTFTNSGTLNFTNGSFSSGDFYQTTGSTHLGTNFTVSGNVRVNGGTFTGRGGATGIFYNNGTLNPGASPGFISTAHYTNTFAATVNLELAGTNAPGTNYDQLRFTGTAVFDGNLNVSLANSFAPLLGNSFTAAVFTARSGTFANIIPPPGVGLTATYSTTNLVLNISTLTNVPLQITSFPTNVGVWTPDGAAFSIGVSGTTPISYQWQFNGTNISGATNVTYALASSVVSNAGIYNVVVTDGASATTNASATLAVTQFTGLITWTNVAGGSWNVPTNWVPARVPNATNTAIITNAGSYTVTVDADAAVSNLLVGLNGAPVTNQLTVYPASLTVGSNATFATNATLYLASTFVNSNLVVVDGKFYFDAGALAGNGRWLLGTNSITTLRTGGYKYLNSGFVENFGAFNFDGTEYRGLAFANNVTFTNQPGGNISLGYSGFSAQSGATNNPLVNRSLITAPGNPSSLGAPFLNETNGTLAVTSSCYVYTGTNRGTLEVLAPLATLAFVSGNFNLETGSQLRGLGTIGANFYGVLNFNTPIICSNQINAYGATASPVININAHLTNRYTVSVSKGDFNVAPGITLDAASINVAWQYQTYTHSTFNNGGTVIADTLAQSYGSLVNSNQLFVRSNFNFSGGSFINNSAANKLTTLSNCVSTITTASYSVGKSFNGGLWENFGTVNFDAPALNSLYFAGGAGWINRSNAVINAGSDALVVNYDGTNWLANYGLIQRGGAASAPALTLVTTNYNQVSFLNTLIGLGDYTQLSGQTDLGGSEIRGGQLKILGGEIIGATSLTSGATLYNAATLRPGSTIGAMSVSDSFTNTASGVFHMEIAGNSPSQYDTVFVGGPVKLDGTLNLILTNGFIPTVGHSYTAMTYTVRSGQFANVVMPGYDFEVIYLTNALILKSSNALPVVTFSVASGNSTQLVCNPFRVTASATDLDGVVTNLTVRLDTTTIANTTGGAINATSEIDFPSTVNFIATAIDDHAGSRSVTQALQLVTLPLHQLTLGGKRTNDFKICMLGQPGSNYILYATTNVQTPFINWSNLGVMENTNGIWRYRDASTITNRPFRYYKAKQQ